MIRKVEKFAKERIVLLKEMKPKMKFEKSKDLLSGQIVEAEILLKEIRDIKREFILKK